MRNSRPRLVLFDIDETLMFSDGVGRKALTVVISEIFKVDADMSAMSLSGKTDPQICHELLASLGFPEDEIDSKLPSIFENYVPQLADELSRAARLGLHVGVLELLQKLSTLPEISLGLLTGNIERGARLKLNPFGLNDYFPVGAFGCDARDRMRLPEVALKRGQAHYGHEFTPPDMVIIGDAQNDVLCAKGFGACSIAVNTGRTPYAELVKLAPNFLFADLSQTELVAEAILHCMPNATCE